MRLSRKKAIELCVELWEWLAKTGKYNKEDWPGWKIYPTNTYNECWLCEYAWQRKGKKISSVCPFCPYYKIYGNCYGSVGEKKKYYRSWVDARFDRTRKKYAKLFLEQIKTLRT